MNASNYAIGAFLMFVFFQFVECVARITWAFAVSKFMKSENQALLVCRVEEKRDGVWQK